MKNIDSTFMSRNLNDKNLNEITRLLNLSDLGFIDNYVSIDDKWLSLKNFLINILNSVAPVKKSIKKIGK